MTPRDLAVLQAIVDAGATGAVVLAAVRAMDPELGSVRNLPQRAGPNTDADAEPAAITPAPKPCDASPVTAPITVTPGAARTRKWRAKLAASQASQPASRPSLELASSNSFLEEKDKKLASRAREVTTKVTAIVRTLKDTAEERVAEVARWLDVYPERYILEKVSQVRQRSPTRKIGCARYFRSMLADGTQGNLGLHVAAQHTSEPAYLTPPPGCRSLEEERAAYRRGANGG